MFDSAFDEIVRVPYLSLTESRELVDKRVVGVPPPFVDLAHCQSGGLARDLIRALDQMVGLRGEDKALTPITNASVHRELRGKLQATVTALRPIPLEPQVTNVLKALYRLDLCPDDTLDSDRCVRRGRWLERVGALDLGVGGIDGDERASLRTLQRLAGEYTGFAYYCRTLIEFFRLDRFGVHGFLAAEGAAPSEPAGFEYLARARQNLAINPHLAWEQISNFRDGHGLESLPFPQSLLGGPASVASRGPQSISSDPRSDSRAVLDAARQSA